MVVLGFLLWKPQPDLEPWYIAGDMDNINNMRTRNSVIALTQDFCSNGLTNWKWSVTRDIDLYFHTTFPNQHSNKEIITVLVIHGGPGIPYPEPWEALQMLQNQSYSESKYRYRYRFIYYHQRGSGKSTRSLDKFENSNNYKENVHSLVEVYGLQEHVADIVRINHLLTVEGSLCFQDYKLLIVGHSFGGFLATLFAAEFPDFVKGLVLVEPDNMIRYPSEREDVFLTVRKNLGEKDRALFDEWSKEYLDYTNPSLFKKSERELANLHAQFFEFWGKAAKWDMPTPPLEMIGGWMVYGIQLSMGLSHDYSSVLREIETPVLLIHGEKDLVSMKNVMEFQRLLRYSEVDVIEDAGHFPFNESPEEFAHLLSKFLISLEGEEEDDMLDDFSD
eukprot:TRINITY_DN779_c0_g1_i12.p1 TRINITY_DN779_c0_g1~~TRINITY_DN779_c0_g1_i12.p1  ORF type:complete len:443 (+),score=99.04 TRINITY_DN779_c0_g1_i12:160-1329(+)